MDMRICQLELPNHVAGIGCKDTETRDEDDAGDETDGGEDTGETEDAKGDGLCNLDDPISMYYVVSR